MRNAYNIAELIVGVFCACVFLHTFTVVEMGGAEAITSSADAYQMAQDLVYYRAAFTGSLLGLYIFFRFTKRPVAKVLTIVALISWVAFIEDYLALDNIFYLAESLTGKATQILRPVYLVAIVYMAVEAYRRESNHG